jgi:hypothetical protein
MTTERADQIIVISLFVLLASTVGSKLTEGTSRIPQKRAEQAEAKTHYGRIIVGGFLTMFFASMAAVAAPEVGALLAVSVAGYAFFTDGLPAINRPFKAEQAKEKKLEKAIKGKGGTVFPPLTEGPQAAPTVGVSPSPTNLGGEFI